MKLTISALSCLLTCACTFQGVVSVSVSASVSGLENGDFRVAPPFPNSPSTGRLGIEHENELERKRLRFLLEERMPSFETNPLLGVEMNPASMNYLPSHSSNGPVLETRQGNTCDFCSATGSCGRSGLELGNSYSVTVTSRSNEYSLLKATCRAAEYDLVDCMYAPNNEIPFEIEAEMELIDAYRECQNSCCNYIYPRYRLGSSLEWSNPGCTNARCRYMERVCVAQATTISCPVGSIMLVGK